MTSFARGVAAAGTALALSLALAACTSLGRFDRANDFEEAQKRFTQLVRWGQISKASEWVAPDQRAEFLTLAPEFTDVRFTDYEILDVKLADDARSATAEVRYLGYLVPSYLERSVDLTQQWSCEAGSGWQVRLETARIRGALAGAAPRP
jgi:hypothetical protein